MGQVLGKAAYPEKLDDAPGPRAQLRITALTSWLEEGGELRVTVPARLQCARCDGGGCDGCGRSGALRSPADPERRTVSVHLSPTSAECVRIRLSQPFKSTDIDQLFIAVVAGPRPSEGVRRIPPPRQLPTTDLTRRPIDGSDRPELRWAPEDVAIVAALLATALWLLTILTSW